MTRRPRMVVELLRRRARVKIRDLLDACCKDCPVRARNYGATQRSRKVATLLRRTGSKADEPGYLASIEGAFSIDSQAFHACPPGRFLIRHRYNASEGGWLVHLIHCGPAFLQEHESTTVVKRSGTQI